MCANASGAKREPPRKLLQRKMDVSTPALLRALDVRPGQKLYSRLREVAPSENVTYLCHRALECGMDACDLAHQFHVQQEVLAYQLALGTRFDELWHMYGPREADEPRPRREGKGKGYAFASREISSIAGQAALHVFTHGAIQGMQRMLNFCSNYNVDMRGGEFRKILSGGVEQWLDTQAAGHNLPGVPIFNALLSRTRTFHDLSPEKLDAMIQLVERSGNFHLLQCFREHDLSSSSKDMDAHFLPLATSGNVRLLQEWLDKYWERHGELQDLPWFDALLECVNNGKNAAVKFIIDKIVLKLDTDSLEVHGRWYFTALVHAIAGSHVGILEFLAGQSQFSKALMAHERAALILATRLFGSPRVTRLVSGMNLGVPENQETKGAFLDGIIMLLNQFTLEAFMHCDYQKACETLLRNSDAQERLQLYQALARRGASSLLQLLHDDPEPVYNNGMLSEIVKEIHFARNRNAYFLFVGIVENYGTHWIEYLDQPQISDALRWAQNMEGDLFFLLKNRQCMLRKGIVQCMP